MTATDPRSWSNVYHGQEPGRASLLASRVMVDGTAARQEPRPTEPRFMERRATEEGEERVGMSGHRKKQLCVGRTVSKLALKRVPGIRSQVGGWLR